MSLNVVICLSIIATLETLILIINLHIASNISLLLFSYKLMASPMLPLDNFE